MRNLDESAFSLFRKSKSNFDEQAAILKRDGYLVLDHLVGTSQVNEIIEILNKKISNFEFRKPLLSQAKIDPVKHRDLIERNFLLERTALPQFGLDATISSHDSLNEFISRERPTTLEVDMPDDSRFYSIWLDEIIIGIISNYFGFTPVLCEAFIRRNYPSEYQIMNHGWHRDKNHPKHLLKVFLFLNDCTLENGPHHFLEKSHTTDQLNKKNYYSDEEVSQYSDEIGLKEVKSIVPKGTIIIEDTRGLHKAGIPQSHYRDLGFATFMPNRLIMKRKPDYTISAKTRALLSSWQSQFIITK
jgi:ectoine hydroxylase-related dioxygenase (phytanoyl-CoA dioxygenase family)